MSVRLNQRSITIIFMVILIIGVSPLSAWSRIRFWPKKNKNEIEIYQPPPADTIIRECDPIKAEIQNIYKKNAFVRTFLIPRREYLLGKHKKCKRRFADQEYDYLKHIEIANPALDPLPEDKEPK